MEYKTCKDCKSSKPVGDFYLFKNRVGSYCKTCHVKRTSKYPRKHLNPYRHRLISGYKLIKTRCGKQKNYENVKCLMSKDDFVNTYINDKNFIELYDRWIESGKSSKLLPSVDRIDSRGHYEISNIRWVTVEENGRKAMQEYYTNNKSHRAKPVAMYTPDGVYVKEFTSAFEAMKELGKNNNGNNIARVCDFKGLCAGHLWKYVDK